MTKQVQRRRGTASQHTSFTGAEGEISVNTTNKSVHVHDGVTAGGVEAARADLANVSDASLNTALAGNTLSSLTITSADINGGTIDGTVIGGTTPAAVTATSLTATGTTTLAGASTTADITFGDNDKAIFGAGSDLQIYHSGSNSIIRDTGQGDFYLAGDANVYITNSALGEFKASFTSNGAATLFYDNSTKFTTTSTGIDVTGTVTADGLTVDGSGTAQITSTSGTTLELIRSGTAGQISSLIMKDGGNAQNRINSSGGALEFEYGASNLNALKIDNNGDISFYEDTGITPKMVWSASAESLGIGTSTIHADLHLGAASPHIDLGPSAGNRGKVGFDSNNVYIGSTSGTGEIHFKNNIGSTDAPHSSGDTKMVIADSGVGIGTSLPSHKLHVSGTGSVSSRTFATDVGGDASFFAGNDNGQIVGPLVYGSGKAAYGALGTSETALYSNRQLTIMSDNASGIIKFATGGNTERMRIDASGNVGIGVVPSAWRSTTDAIQFGQSASISSNNNANAISFTSNAYINSSNNSVRISTGKVTNYYQFDGAHVWDYAGSGAAGTTVTYSEAMRIDASGNLLVGKTAANTSIAGAELREHGGIVATRSGSWVGHFNRLSDDGEILKLLKDGATVGSIGTSGGSAYVGGYQNAGIYFNGTTDIRPWNTSTRANLDNSITLGSSSARFKDLYLSGGVYLGGTGAANYLDDYEYGDYQVTFTPSGGGSITVSGSHDDLKYTKIGSRVFVTGKVDISAVSSPSGYISVTLPFVVHNSGTVNDSRRFTGSVWVINAAIETYKFQLYGIEGESSVRIYNGSGTGLASTSANQFSGDEGVAFSFNYETTP